MPLLATELDTVHTAQFSFDADELNALGNHPDRQVREAIVNNPNTPLHTRLDVAVGLLRLDDPTAPDDLLFEIARMVIDE